MNTSTIIDQKGRQEPNRFLYLGLFFVVLLFALVVYEYLWPSSVRVYEPEFLLPFLNTLLFLAACVVAYIAGRIYLISGLPAILWIGCGVLTLALGALSAGWLIIPFGPNANVTIFNVGALLSSICHIGSMAASLGGSPAQPDPSRRKRNVWIGYLSVLLGIILLVVLTVTNLTPAFFLQGKGPTIIRQNVAGWAIVLFLAAALFAGSRFRRQKAAFLYWYSLALALLALAMLAFLLQPAVGSPIGWVGRGSYVLAAVYFLISVMAGLREARAGGVRPHWTVLEMLVPGVHWQDIMATVSDAVVSFNDRGEILLWNQAAARIFGYPEAEAIGHDLLKILPSLGAMDRSGLSGGITAIELKRRDGSRFSAEVSVSAADSPWGEISTLVVRDVTARQRAEAELKRQRQEMQIILDSVPAMIFYKDKENRFIRVNQEMAALSGLPREGIEGKTAFELYPTQAKDYWQDDMDVMASGDPKRDIIESMEGPGGLRWVRTDKIPYRDAQGNIIGVIGFSMDITERRRAEEAVARSKAEFEAIFNSLSDAVVFVDPERRVLMVNPGFERLWGYTAEEMRGQNTRILYADPADYDGMGQDVYRLGAKIEGNLFERQYRRKDGSTFYAETRVAHVTDAQGNLLGFTAIHRDITERKQAEAETQRLLIAVQQEKDKLSALVNSIRDEVWFADTQKKFTLVNPSALREFGLGSTGEIDVANLAETLEVYRADGSRRDIEEAPPLRALRGEIVSNVEEIIRTPGSGELRYRQVNAAPVKDVSGNIIGSVSVVRDITELKQAEEALRRLNDELEQRVEERTQELEETVAQLEEEMSDRLRAEAELARLNEELEQLVKELRQQADLLELAHDAIIVRDLDSRVLFWSHGAEETYGFRKEEVLGQVTHDLLRTQFPIPMEEIDREILLQGRWYGELVHTRADGATIVVATRHALQKDEKGEPVAILEINRDVTERKQAEQELARLNVELEQRVRERTAELEFANRELEAFAYSVSHDLKAPIRAIQGFSRVLAGERASCLDEEGHRLLQVIVNNTQVMSKLIDDLLALSRLGRHQMRKTRIDLSAMVRQAFDRLRAEVPDREIQLTVADLPPAWGDHSLINQVIINLMDNAIKYTKAQKTASIEVGGYPQGRETIYYVRDNGIGFDERYVSKLFGVFQRLHSGQDYEGTGVGLAIVQRIIQRHGGRVWAEGKVNEGATFYFALPG